MAAVIWQGVIDSRTYRVVDAGAPTQPRLTVEQQQSSDAMGVLIWSTLDPLPRAVFEGILFSAGVVS